jgi:putative endopeptidase
MSISRLLAPSIIALTISLTSCNSTSSLNESNTPELGSYGIATENMDLSVKPGDNFFKYVNGTWLANTEIPADKSTYGGFSILADRSEERVRKIIEEASSVNAAMGSDEQKIGDFFAAFMDTDAIEKAGLLPVLADLETIKSVSNHEGYRATHVGAIIRLEVGGFPFHWCRSQRCNELYCLPHSVWSGDAKPCLLPR